MTCIIARLLTHLTEHLVERLTRSIQHNQILCKATSREIVGAFAADPITINIISGDGSTPSPVVTVTTQIEHGLNSKHQLRFKILVKMINLSTKVVQVISETEFTYALPFVRPNLKAGPNAGLRPNPGAAVIIETDTVSGASPYIFNCSLRSVMA